jgi:hypothetical protein
MENNINYFSADLDLNKNSFQLFDLSDWEGITFTAEDLEDNLNKEDCDWWGGFNIEEKSFDLNIYRLEEEGKLCATVYEVINGHTNTLSGFEVDINTIEKNDVTNYFDRKTA